LPVGVAGLPIGIARHVDHDAQALEARRHERGDVRTLALLQHLARGGHDRVRGALTQTRLRLLGDSLEMLEVGVDEIEADAKGHAKTVAACRSEPAAIASRTTMPCRG